MNNSSYIVLFEDQTSKKYQSLDALVDTLDDLDGLNVAHYFNDERGINQLYPFQALTSWGELCMISAQ